MLLVVGMLPAVDAESPLVEMEVVIAQAALSLSLFSFTKSFPDVAALSVDLATVCASC